MDTLPFVIIIPNMTPFWAWHCIFFWHFCVHCLIIGLQSMDFQTIHDKSDMTISNLVWSDNTILLYIVWFYYSIVITPTTSVFLCHPTTKRIHVELNIKYRPQSCPRLLVSKLFSVRFLIYLGFEALPGGSQGLLLALYPSIISGSTRKTMESSQDLARQTYSPLCYCSHPGFLFSCQVFLSCAL